MILKLPNGDRPPLACSAFASSVAWWSCASCSCRCRTSRGEKLVAPRTQRNPQFWARFAWTPQYPSHGEERRDKFYLAGHGSCSPPHLISLSRRIEAVARRRGTVPRSSSPQPAYCCESCSTSAARGHGQCDPSCSQKRMVFLTVPRVFRTLTRSLALVHDGVY